MGELLSFSGVWVVTYLMHSTILLSTVGLIDHFRWLKSNTSLEFLWRVAIVGGLVTATFQCAFRNLDVLAIQRWSLGRLMVCDNWFRGSAWEPNELQALPANAMIDPTMQEAEPRRQCVLRREPGNEHDSHIDGGGQREVSKLEHEFSSKTVNSTDVVDSPSKINSSVAKNSSSQPDLTYAYAERFALRFVIILAYVWLIGAVFNTLRLVLLGMRAHSDLKNRTIVDASASNDAQPSCHQMVLPKKLSVSTNIDGPMALPNGEIVVPTWIMDSLSSEHRQAVYAHEIAHQLRRDPIWLLFLHFMSNVFWIQPLHRLARRRLVHLAELQADAWAARMLSNARVLAESLVACAERVVATPRVSFGSSFSSKGALIERVDCLLDGSARSNPGRSNLAQVSAVVFLLLAMFLMPGCNVDSEIAYRSGEKISVTKQGDGKKGEIMIRRANLLVKLSHTGSMKLTAQNDDVESLEKGGRLQLAESHGSQKRVYTIATDDLGNLNRTFSQDGKATPIDEEVQSWFAEALRRTVSESGF